jgi:HK97 family phage prohead protease
MDPAEFFDALSEVPNHRSIAFADVEMKDTSSGYHFDGIAAPVGVPADLGAFTEEYERGTFRRFLSSCRDNIPLVHEHNTRDLLATTRSGRLKLSEDVRGLRAIADIVKTPLSETIKALVEAGEIGGMSIGMVVGRGNATVEHRGGKPHRRIQGLKKILDVCTTYDPSYASTEVQFRSAAMQWATSPESLQQLLVGAYPQLQAQGNGEDDAIEEEPPAGDATQPDGAEQDAGDREEPGPPEQRSVAARQRALQLLIYELGGDERVYP